MRVVLLAERPELREVQHDDCQNCAELDDDLEHLLEFVRDVQLEELIHEDHVSGAAHREPFCDTLYNAEDDSLQKFKKIHKYTFLYSNGFC